MSTEWEQDDRDKLEAVLKSFEEDLNIRHEEVFEKDQDMRPEEFPEGWYPEDLRNDMAKHLKEIEKSVTKKNALILNGRMDPPVTYDDGDQSLVTDEREQVLLRIEWSTYLENFFPLETPWLSDWSRILFSGEYQDLLDILKHRSDKDIQMLLKKREHFASLSALFHLVNGASRLNFSNITMIGLMKITDDYKGCLEHLISLGADVNARDMAGFTPLHYCVKRDANDITLTLAEVLLKAGADVNVRNRTGLTPLAQAVHYYKYDFIQLLLDHGADPHIGEYSKNFTPSDVARTFPRIQEMFSKASKRHQKNEREKIKETEGINNCQVCKKLEDGNKRCSGCYMIFYCGRECQVKDWDNHKEDCKKIQKEYKSCHIAYTMDNPDTARVCGSLMWDIMSKVLLKQNTDVKKSHFVVKVSLQCKERTTN